MRRLVLAMWTGCAAFSLTQATTLRANAQEIQMTGPLAGAPAVRKLRLHREGRFEVAPSVSFTLLDEYQRTILPGLRAQYHLTDWFAVGVFGGVGLHYTTGLTDELQEKAIDNRRCSSNPSSKECRLTEVQLPRKGKGMTGNLADDQLAAMQWLVAPQIAFIPFRGKLALFGSLFVDTDVHFFLGPAFVGLQERAECGFDTDKKALTPCATSHTLDNRVAVAPTFGLGLNFYPGSFIGFGIEWRGLPYSWNTAGFDNHGGGPDEEFPDTAVNGNDQEFQFNNMLTVNLMLAFPTQLKSSE